MRTGSLSHQTDEQLAALGRGGSDEAFAEIVRRYGPALRAKCTRIAGRDLADDALAQTWLQTVAALRRPNVPPALEPWLHRVAYNCSIDQLRARRQQESLTPPCTHPSDPPEAELERKQSLRDLVQGLSTLPENQRDALVLREFEGWSYVQIAEWLEEPPSGIHQLIFRARSALRRGLCALAPWGPLRALVQHLAAIAPTGSGGSLRFGLAMIGAALLGGGAATPGDADKPPRSRAIHPADASTVEPTRDVVRTATVRERPPVVFRSGAQELTGGLSLRQKGMGDGSEPTVPAELVSVAPPHVPEPVDSTAPTPDLAHSEAQQVAPAPAAAAPASDPPGGDAPDIGAAESEPAPAPAPEPVDEEPVEDLPATSGDNPGRGHGPPAWAPAKGHGKHQPA